MKYRAIIKQEKDWWIGWLVDLPGVNAQEKSYDELLESLKLGAADMPVLSKAEGLALEPEIPEDAHLETVEV